MTNHTMWQIHWVGGGKSLEGSTDEVYQATKDKMDDVEWIENITMRPFIFDCIRALRNHTILGTDGLFYSYIGANMYEEVDPATGDSDTIPEIEVRRKLQKYYTSNTESYIEDKAHIEERARELA